MKRIKFNYKFLRPGLLAAFMLLVFMVPAGAQAVFYDNTENIPAEPVQNDMYRTFAQGGWNQAAGGVTNNQCGYGATKYNHAQWTWITAAGSNTNTTVEIPSNNGVPTDSAQFQLNATAAICDSIINNTTQQITDTTLQETRTRLSNVRVRYNGVIRSGVTVSGLATEFPFDYSFNYNDGAGNQRRFVKYIGSVPYFDEFTMSGIRSLGLTPRDEPYTIELIADNKAINRYSSGAAYRCVNNGGSPLFGWDWESTTCPKNEDVIAATIKLYVRESYAGRCDVTKINGAPVNGQPVYLNAGESFTASFVVKNDGLEPWYTIDNPNTPEVESQIILGSDTPMDNLTWGKMRARITGDSFGGTAHSPGGTTPEFTHTFTVPSDFNGERFDWRLLKEPGPGIITKIGDTCGAEIKPRVNHPFLRVSGGDTYAGVAFANNQYSCSAYPGLGAAQNANIGTNGKWSYPTDETQLSDKFFGASTGQYGVFATGLIGNDSQNDNNNFLGNGAHVRHTTNGAQDVFEKDMLFANQGNTPAQSYGKFDSVLPCFDISQLEKLPLTTPGTFSSFVNSANTPSLVRVNNLNISALTTINPNRRVVVLVDDPAGVTIGQEIRHAASPNVNQTPFLMIISKGPIYIQKGVSRIDAHLVAFPAYDNNGNLPAKSGTIDTCSDASIGQEGTWPTGTNKLTIGSCNSSQLVVNGSLVAKKVLWKRTRGSLNASSVTTDSVCSFSDGVTGEPSYQVRLRACAAEHVKFSPEAYFNNPLNSTGPSTATVGSSPIGTKELPPTF